MAVGNHAGISALASLAALSAGFAMLPRTASVMPGQCLARPLASGTTKPLCVLSQSSDSPSQPICLPIVARGTAIRFPSRLRHPVAPASHSSECRVKTIHGAIASKAMCQLGGRQWRAEKSSLSNFSLPAVWR